MWTLPYTATVFLSYWFNSSLPLEWKQATIASNFRKLRLGNCYEVAKFFGRFWVWALSNLVAYKKRVQYLKKACLIKCPKGLTRNDTTFARAALANQSSGGRGVPAKLLKLNKSRLDIVKISCFKCFQCFHWDSCIMVCWCISSYACNPT